MWSVVRSPRASSATRCCTAVGETSLARPIEGQKQDEDGEEEYRRLLPPPPVGVGVALLHGRVLPTLLPLPSFHESLELFQFPHPRRLLLFLQLPLAQFFRLFLLPLLGGAPVIAGQHFAPTRVDDVAQKVLPNPLARTPNSHLLLARPRRTAFAAVALLQAPMPATYLLVTLVRAAPHLLPRLRVQSGPLVAVDRDWKEVAVALELHFLIALRARFHVARKLTMMGTICETVLLASPRAWLAIESVRPLVLRALDGVALPGTRVVRAPQGTPALARAREGTHFAAAPRRRLVLAQASVRNFNHAWRARLLPLTHNNNNNSNSSKGSSKRGTSLSSGTATPVNGTLSKPVSPPVVPELHLRQDVVVHSPNSQEEMIKLKRYEEEIKQRREREEEAAELQRNSIRGSQKLQSLASYPHGTTPQVHSGSTQPAAAAMPSGVVNQAFDHEGHPENRTNHQQEEEEGEEEDRGSSPSINELIQSLQRIQNVLKSNGHRISEDMTLVAQLLVNPEFQKVLAVHNKVQETWCLNRPPTPLTFKAQELVNECIEVLNGSSSPEALELVEILSKFPVEGLFYAHDRIADSEPMLEGVGAEHSVDVAPPPPEEETVMVERETNYPEENVCIVRIDKTNEPLGATIRNEGDSVIIGRIVQGGAAEKSDRLHEGDEILEVNGVEVRGKSVNDVCDMLAGMTGTLTFIIIPCSSLPVAPPPPPVHAMHVKAYFDYDPEDDLFIPCRELGMSFQKGDILHVMNQQDPNWWQAYRDGEEDQSLAGLIPSRAFQQQREAMRQTVVGDNNNKEKSKKGKLLCAKKHQKKKKKKMLYPNYNEDYDAEEILTYEEVSLYFPRTIRKRPIVLIGPPNIGRHELRQKLMEDTEKFAAAVPHTSRIKRDQEVDGADYHFISRTQFEADILARKFVEHGEFEKSYYGTSLDAIRAVVNSGKICVLNLHPLSLKMLKNSDLMPYVVLIAPPSLEKLRLKKQKLGEPFKEDDLKETIQKAREMEDQYGHYFDLVLINQEVDRTYQQLTHEINVLEREPQWVPATWLANER